MDANTMDAAGVITFGRVGFSETYRNIFQTQAPLAHGVFGHGGPYWDQTLTFVTLEAMKHKPKFLLFYDGDSVWEMEDLWELYRIIDGDDTIDAVWPVQADRAGRIPLVHHWRWWKPTEYDYRKDVMPAVHGHFGCTFIRTTAFEQMQQPFFWSQPATDGTWDLKPGKLDADTYFWTKLNDVQEKTGQRCVQANNTVIGHMELHVRWQHGKDILTQNIHEFRKHGKPYGCRAPLDSEVGEHATPTNPDGHPPTDPTKTEVRDAAPEFPVPTPEIPVDFGEEKVPGQTLATPKPIVYDDGVAEALAKPDDGVREL